MDQESECRQSESIPLKSADRRDVQVDFDAAVNLS